MENTLNNDLISLVLKKNELSRLDYNDPSYDIIEEELHDQEDTFLENHGKYLEGVLNEIHKKLGLDNDVLLPIAYLAKKYRINKDEGKTEFNVDPEEGVLVDSEQYQNKTTRLVLIPNPIRFLLQIQGSHQKEIWKYED